MKITGNRVLLFSRFIRAFVQRFPWLLDVINNLILELNSEKNALLVESSRAGSVRSCGRWVDSVETQPDDEKELVKRVISSFAAAKKMQANTASPYQPSGAWKGFLMNG